MEETFAAESDFNGTPPADVPEPEPEPERKLEWYILHTYSRFEKRVQDALRSRIEGLGMEQRLGEILVPTEDTIELRNGKKVTVTRLLYPGYVIVQLDLNDDLWHAVKNTPKVTGFVGGGPSPVPLTPSDVNKVFRPTTDTKTPDTHVVRFKPNDPVSIIDGPFTGFSGKVEEVGSDRTTLKVMVTIFGRPTPVELEYYQVKKAS